MKNITHLKFNIDHRKKDDLVTQVIDSIKTDIIELRFQHGQMLPDLNEISLTNKLDISVISTAFSKLLNDGFLHKKDNKYFINRHRFIDDFKEGMKTVLVSITEQGQKARFETLLVEYVSSLPEILKSRSKNLKSKYIHIRRLFYANEIPFAHVDFYYDAALLPDFNDISYDQVLIYDYLKLKHPYIIKKGARQINATIADKKITDILKIPNHMPLLCINYIGYDELNNEIEYAIGYSTSNYEISQINYEII